MRFLFVFICVVFQTVPANAETVFTVRGPEYPGDTRMEYDYDLMKLALDLTVESHGPYKLVKTPIGLNYKRAMEFAQKRTFPNFFMRNVVSQDALQELTAVKFPVERGIAGYRVAFIKPNLQEEIGQVENISDLRKYDIIQGIGWPDNLILKANGLRVLAGPSFSSIRDMVVNDRAQLFLRGANEILQEYQQQTDDIPLAVEKHVLIYYPFPRLLFTAKENTEAANRVEIGLLKACKNGSFTELWEKHFLKNLEKLDLKSRKTILLKNPFLERVEELLEEFKKLPPECRPLAL